MLIVASTFPLSCPPDGSLVSNTERDSGPLDRHDFDVAVVVGNAVVAVLDARLAASLAPILLFHAFLAIPFASFLSALFPLLAGVFTVAVAFTIFLTGLLANATATPINVAIPVPLAIAS